MTAQPKQRYTLEEYLELDRNSDARLEYWDGEIFDMSGVSERLDEVVKLVALDCELALRDIYENVSFAPPTVAPTFESPSQS